MKTVSKVELCEMAKKASYNAYAEYSGCRVGAALLARSGKVYTGVNIENASYPAGICAERSAFAAAVSSGEREFEMLAVAGGKNGEFSKNFTPCGICRQFINKFADESFLILIAGDSSFDEYKAFELLPSAFKKSEVK